MNAAIHPRPAAERAPSYYAATLNEETDYPTLLGAVTVDIAIIGGGFTGVATAVELAERGYKVALVETHRIGWGASGRNGGQVTGSLSGDAAMHKQMRQWLGAEVEDFIWHLRWRGHEIIRQRVEKYGIACDLRHGHLHAAMKASHMGELQASYEEAVRRGMGDQVVLLDKAGVQAHLETELYCGALKNTRNMHLHPLNLCIGEARAAAGLGALIFEHSEVLDIVHGPRPAVITREGRIEAQQILLAGDVSPQARTQAAQGDDLPGHGRNRYHPAAGRAGTGDQPAGAGGLRLPLRPRLLPPHRRRPPAVRWRRQLLGPRLAGHHRRAAAMHRAHLPAPEGRGDRVPVELRHGHRDEPDPPARQALRQRLVLPGLLGHGVATSHIMGEIMAKAMSGSLEQFDTFARCKHLRVPLGDLFGNPMLAAGMWYYQLMEKLR